MPKSNYLARALVNHVFCGPGSQSPQSPFPQPSGLYVALFTATPTPSGGGTEISGGTYVRQHVSFAPASSAGESFNDVELIFPIASTDWGVVNAFAIFTAATAGNMLFFEALSIPIQVVTGDRVRFPIGALTVKET